MTNKEKKKVQILAVSIDTHEESKQFIALLRRSFPRGEFDFSLLEDRNHKVIDRYGLLNPNGKGWPHPATYVVDRHGTVRWRFVEVDFTKRATNKQIMGELRKLLE